MSLKGLKRKSANSYYLKQLKKFKKDDPVLIKKIDNIGILANSRLFGSYDITRNLSQKFNLPSRCFEVIIFEDLKDDFVSQHYNTFTEKDLGMFGKAKAPNVVDFIDTEFDLLINYCPVTEIYTNILTMRSKAKLKVSFASEEMLKIYDFTIDVQGNKIDVFNDELAKYLKIFKFISA
ncbi:MAG: hypothetical protein CR985_01315 [Flavobacteriales bacterium]|nr:MAG: hypothetical protein CR985_01315 [Flavobacteriales bacterium]